MEKRRKTHDVWIKWHSICLFKLSFLIIILIIVKIIKEYQLKRWKNHEKNNWLTNLLTRFLSHTYNVQKLNNLSDSCVDIRGARLNYAILEKINN